MLVTLLVFTSCWQQKELPLTSRFKNSFNSLPNPGKIKSNFAIDTITPKTSPPYYRISHNLIQVLDFYRGSVLILSPNFAACENPYYIYFIFEKRVSQNSLPSPHQIRGDLHDFKIKIDMNNKFVYLRAEKWIKQKPSGQYLYFRYSIPLNELIDEQGMIVK